MKRRHAFTLVEVMVSLGVMTIGSMAIVGMQQQTTRANVRARELSTALQIAQTWIERLKTDGANWSTVGNSTTDLLGTTFLSWDGAAVSGNGTAGLFTTLPITAPLAAAGLSNGFDYYGNDQTDMIANNSMEGSATISPVYYCASYRLTWVFRDISTNPPSQDRALRADVRVWWPNERGSAQARGTRSAFAQEFSGCRDNGLSLSPPGNGNSGTQYDNYHIVYLSTVIRPMQ